MANYYENHLCSHLREHLLADCLLEGSGIRKDHEINATPLVCVVDTLSCFFLVLADSPHGSNRVLRTKVNISWLSSFPLPPCQSTAHGLKEYSN